MINQPTPTLQTSAELQIAFDHFNEHLFDSKLPQCLITLQREKNCEGYFSHKRFTNHRGEAIDEIALNPSFFLIRSLTEIMQTLVHEQCHLYQQWFGKAGRGRYHNKEWADLMESIGLMPSSTGKEGGKRTGDKMSDYPIEGGRFLKACDQLLTKKYLISWADRFPPKKAMTHNIEALSELENWHLTIDENLNIMTEDGESIIAIESPKKNRTKYTCNNCGINVWGKSDLIISCNECAQTLTEC